MNTNILIIYAVMNILTFITYGADKFKAFRNKYRISEKTLLIMSVFGIFGALAGMFLFRHKNNNPHVKRAVFRLPCKGLYRTATLKGLV